MNPRWWLLFAAAGCAHPAPPPIPQPTPAPGVPVTQTTEEGFVYRLKNATEVPDAGSDRPRVAPATPLARGVIDTLLGRLSPLEPAPTSEFSVRAGTQPPPTAATRIDLPFPPPGTADAPVVEAGPLAVTRHAPDGAVPLAPQVSISFNHPMIPLTTQDAAAAMVPVTLEPKVEGQWRWVGTKTLLFEPPVRMPAATTYTVAVPAGTRADDGAVLSAATTFTFSTPPPRVVSSSPSGPATALVPVIAVRFDQAVDPMAVLNTARIQAGGASTPLKLATAEQIAADPQAQSVLNGALPGTAVAFVPAEPLPYDTLVEVVVPKGTPSAEGPLTTTGDQAFSFHTHGALRLVATECGWNGRCPPGATWSLELSNDLAVDDPTPLVQITPELPAANIWTSGNRLYIEGNAAPRTTYQINVSKDILDTFGQHMGADARTSVAVTDADPLSPMISVAGANPQVADPFSSPKAHFYVGGLGKARLRVHAVTPEDLAAYAEHSWYDADNAELPGKKVADEIRTFSGDPNTPQLVDLDLSPWLTEGHGHLVIELAGTTGSRWERPGARVWVSATHIGLHSLRDAEGTTVWATDLQTGRPLDGVKVRVPGVDVERTTDSRGRAQLPPIQGATGPLVATRGTDSAIASPSGGSYLYEDWGPEAQGSTTGWFVFDDRHLYRPAETVSIKGWVRSINHDKGGDLAPAGSMEGSVSWVATDAYGNEMTRGTAQLNAWNGFDLAVKLPPTPALGDANVYFTLPNGDSWSHSFQIQEFRRPEFEVSSKVETAAPHVIGGEAVLSANAHYFAGGPLGDADTTWTVTSTTTSWRPAGWEEWQFGTWEPVWWTWRPWGEPREESEEQVLSGKTDATGTHRLSIAFDSMGKPTARSVHAEAAIADVNRQTWTSSADLLVHPADRYVGLRSDKGWYEPGQVMKVDAVVTDLDGKAAAGTPIDLSLVRRDWRTVRGEWKQTEAIVGSCVLTSAATPGSCSFTPTDGGQHVLRARIADAAGRANETEVTLWVSGGQLEEVTGVTSQSVMLIADQTTYEPGQTAHVAVQAPFAPGYATIAIERSGVLSVEERWIEKPSFVVDVPITEDHIPDVSVRVDLVGTTPRADRADATALMPALASGEVSLRVPPTSRTLAVDIVPARKALSPGEATSLDVTVRDAKGNAVANADVALFMVDEAVLALTGVEVPDPTATFYPTRGAGTAALENRTWIVLDNEKAQLIERRTQATGGAMMTKSAVMRGGMEEDRALPMMAMEAAPMPTPSAAPPPPGGAAGPKIAVRKDFSATAIWLPTATTDARGRLHVDAKLPDNLTRYRITAVAVDKGKAFGKGETDVTARLPLMLRPSAPRFLNFGDMADLPLVVQNQTDQMMTVDVALRASNAKVEGSDRAGRRVSVPPNDRVEIRIPVSADQAGEAHFQAAAATGSYADAAEIRLPVYTPATSEAFATYGTLDGPAGLSALKQSVVVPGDVWPQFGGLQITTSSTALSSLTDAVIQLVDYPYGCVEQIGSRILAVAALRDVLKAFDAPGLPPDAQLTAMVQADLDELKKRQMDDGAWGWWDRNPRYASPFTTLHAVHALVRAKAAGYDVPDRTLQQGLGRIRRIDGMLKNEWSPTVKAALEAHALQIRLLAGEDVGNEALALYKKHGTAGLSLDALGWILPALHGKKATTEIGEIRTFLANRVTETASNAQFTLSYGESEDALILASSRRTDAILLDALLQTRPDDDLLPKLVAGLLDGRNKGHWGSTQEDAWVLLALNRYFRVSEAVTPDLVARAWLGAAYAGDHTYKGRTTETATTNVPMSWMAGKPAQDLVLARDGAGRLYYRLGLSYAPKSLSLAPAERGFAVTRRYEGVDHADDVRQDPDGTWHVKAGARVRVTLTMEAPSRRYHVALVDPLPAGFEALNPALVGTGDVPAEPSDAERSKGWWWGPWYEHENLRDERVEAFSQTVWGGVYTYRYVARATTPGRFVVPPAKAEEMYHPETFGRTGTDRVNVD